MSLECAVHHIYVYQIHWPQILTHNHIFPLLLIDVNNKRFSSLFLHKSRRNFRMDFRTQIVVVITVVQLVLVIQQIGYMNMIHWHCIRRCKVLLTMVKIPVWMRTRDLCQTYLFWKVSKLMVHSPIKICINYSLRHGFCIPVIWWFVECRKTLKLVTNNNNNNGVILTLTFPSTMSKPKNGYGVWTVFVVRVQRKTCAETFKHFGIDEKSTKKCTMLCMECLSKIR